MSDNKNTVKNPKAYRCSCGCEYLVFAVDDFGNEKCVDLCIFGSRYPGSFWQRIRHAFMCVVFGEVFIDQIELDGPSAKQFANDLLKEVLEDGQE